VEPGTGLAVLYNKKSRFQWAPGRYEEGQAGRQCGDLMNNSNKKYNFIKIIS
jgi:hypothetical protein